MHNPGLDFALGPDLDMLRDTVRAFASAKIARARMNRPRRLFSNRSLAADGRAWPARITVEEIYGGPASLSRP